MQIENMVKTTVEEIRKVLTETSVMGEPRTIEGVTLIPIISTGFLFGAGGGTGKPVGGSGGGEGEAGGSAGGVGVKAVAVIVIDKNGVRVEGIRGGLASVVERIAEKAPEFVGQMMPRKKEQKEEPKQG